MNDSLILRAWDYCVRVALDTQNGLALAAIAVLGAALVSVITSSLIPAIAAVSGSIAGIITAHSAHRSSRTNAEQALMAQYLGFIQSLQAEVARLNKENIEQRVRLDQYEREMEHLRARVNTITTQGEQTA